MYNDDKIFFKRLIKKTYLKDLYKSLFKKYFIK